MTHLVKAIFKGEHLSCGYEKNKEYVLKIRQEGSDSFIYLEIANGYGTEKEIELSKVAYNTINGVLNNWDNIRKI